METIKFIIWNHHNLCYIATSDIRKEIRKLSEGGCIGELDILLDEMSRIKREAKSTGYDVVFEIIGEEFL